MTLHFHNTLTRQKEPFLPADPANVRMYVCGPTVYQAPHLGNARSVVIYDVLFRLLREVYGAERVTYARNITDVDDKINAGAKERGVPIRVLTDEVTAEFHRDMAALGCLPPTIEPRATGHMPQIIAMIEALVANGHAYVAEGHVLFDVESRVESRESSDRESTRLSTLDSPPFHWHYGMLSRRSTDEMIAGARVEVAPYKKNPGDFVLWKPSPESDDASSRFESPWGVGRPGWHIECSAMATAHLGPDFDLHGGGADLMFPHHENELAQSCCANPGSRFAGIWVHNGFLTVDGEKMSKSVGNFVTVRDVLDRGVHGEVVRFALLSTHYRKPLDWTEKLLEDAKKQLDYLYHAIEDFVPIEAGVAADYKDGEEAFHFLLNDLDTAGAMATLGALAREIRRPGVHDNAKHLHWKQSRLKAVADVLGLLQADPERWFKGAEDDGPILLRIDARIAAKREKNWAEADRIRDELKAEGILLMDRPDGTTEWRRA